MPIDRYGTEARARRCPKPAVMDECCDQKAPKHQMKTKVVSIKYFLSLARP